jgi:predicted membrane protein
VNPENERQSGFVSVKLVMGVLIVVLGAIFLAENLDLIPSRVLLRRFWPAAFVAVGTAMVLQPGRGLARWWGSLWIVAGVWIWADQQDWIAVNFWQVFFPGALLFAGAGMVWRALHPAGQRAASSEDDGAHPHLFALMAGNEVRSITRGFRGADLGAVMGGVTLDLTRAQMEGESATIDVVAVWGGIEIRVPQDWVVTSQVFPLMGGYEDNTRPAAEGPAKRLVLRGVAVMGGVEVKN